VLGLAASCPNACPVPDNATVCGWVVVSNVIESCPLWFAAAVGAKATLKDVLWPGPKVSGNAGALSVKPFPEMLIWVTFPLALPGADALLNVTMLVFLLPIATLPKFTAVGLIVKFAAVVVLVDENCGAPPHAAAMDALITRQPKPKRRAAGFRSATVSSKFYEE
jgi:hypothetical protein